MMNLSDPGQWQRLAPVSLVFLIANGLQKFIRENLYVFVGAGAGFAFTDWLGTQELMLAALALLLLLVVAAMVYHRRFRFRLEDDAIRVRKGLWVRRELRIRFARIQNIQLSHPFYFRPFGLVRFSLDTPGAAEKEVELPGIPRAMAELIRDRIAEHLNGRERPDGEQPAAVDAGLLHSADTGRLFAHGMASNQVWVLVGAVGYLYSQFYDRFESRMAQMDVFRWLAEQLQSAWFLIPVVLILALLLLMVLSGLVSIVRFHGFRLIDRDDRVVAVGGLLDRREQTVRREKMTGLVLQQSMVGRVIGCWSLIVQQAASHEANNQPGRKHFLVPGLRPMDLHLTRRLLPSVGQRPQLNGISPGFRSIFWMRAFAVWAVIMAVLVWHMGLDDLSVKLAAVAVVVALGVIHVRWRYWGWAVSGDMLWVRRGLLGQRIDVVSLHLVQQAKVGQSPYQFRRDLANLQLTLPQGAVTIPFLSHDVAADLANRAVYAAETALTHRV